MLDILLTIYIVPVNWLGLLKEISVIEIGKVFGRLVAISDLKSKTSGLEKTMQKQYLLTSCLSYFCNQRVKKNKVKLD